MPETIWRPEDRTDADRYVVWDCPLCGLVLRCPHWALTPKATFTGSYVTNYEEH